MNIDRIIARFLPIIGVILFVIGLGYLIYTSVWLEAGYETKIGVGIFTSILLIGMGYSMQEKVRFYADIIIGAGVLLFYGTLIYASRTTDLATALLPENVSLLVVFLFTGAIAYFAKIRNSKEILVLSIIGAYLTPFVIGQEDSWKYVLSYNSYLLYFFSVNLAIFILSRTMFLGDIVPLNGIGLLVSTTMLRTIAYDTPMSSIESLLTNDTMSGILFMLIVATFVIATVRTNRRFPEKHRRFIPFGYLLPFIWFSLNMNMLQISNVVFVTLYGIVGCVYLGSWHLLDKEESDPIGRAFLYTGGVAAFAVAVLKLFSGEPLFAGYVLSGISLIFFGLCFLNPVKERIIAYITLGLVGFLMVGFSHDIILGSKELTLAIGLSPLLLAWGLQKKTNDTEMDNLLKLVGIASGIVLILIFLSYLTKIDISLTLIFCTIPAIIGLSYQYLHRDTIPTETLRTYMIGGTVLLVVGYFSTFFTLIERIYPFPRNIFFVNEIGLKAFLSVIGFFIALAIKRHIEQKNPDQKPAFPIIMLAYSGLLLLVNHQFLALFNSFDISYDGVMHGVRAVITTLWWMIVAGWMIFVGVKHGKSHQPEKILGIFLLGFTLLKIIFYDLSSTSTNMKIIVLMLVGGALMIFSYFLNQKGYLKVENTEDLPENTETEDGIDTLINQKIADIDVSEISHIEFSPTGESAFKTKREDLKKIVILITRKMGKYTFVPGELKEIFTYVKKHYKSELSKTDFDKISEIIKGFVKTGGEVKIVTK